MKINKFRFIALGLVLLLGLVACAPADTGLDNRQRRLTTQTRIGDGARRDSGTNSQENDYPNVGQDNMIDRDGLLGQDNNLMDNSMGLGNRRDNLNTDLNDGMTRPNQDTNLTGDRGRGSEEIAKKISDLPEIDKASVVINNDTALVGCKLRGDTQGTMTTTLRDKIERIVRDTDSNIKNVSITTEPDLYKRIKTMATDLDRGNPVEDFADEIRDLIRRITPNTNR